MNAAVLLAEDEPVSRLFLVDALTSLGVRCDAVDDGFDAIRHAGRTRYDALLLDLNLPGCDGVEILARVRGDAGAGSRDTRALALTADDDDATRERLLAAGFCAVACKPIGLDRLADTLEALGLRVERGRRISEPLPTSVSMPLWDDATALAAAGGNQAIVDTLRGMLRGELPGQRERIAAALERDDAEAARAELHRLQASCGFCGAMRLAASAGALHATLARGSAHAQASAAFLRDADDTLVAAP